MAGGAETHLYGATERAAPLQHSMKPGGAQEGYAGMAQILSPHTDLTVKQINFGGCDCCFWQRKDPWRGFPCCCCQSTSEFEVSGPGGEPLLFAWESSNTWERVCCAPNHAMTMKVVSATEGVSAHTKVIDVAEIEEEFADHVKFATLERKGCSNGYPTCCFSCCTCCNDNMAVYEGDVAGTAGNLVKAPEVTTMMSQPIGGGLFTPTINIDPCKEGSGSPMQVTGPCVLGGWSEICFDSDFQVSQDGNHVATIRHMKPSDFCELLMAYATPLDKYSVTFHTPELNGHDKANVVLSSMLVDYMFFELDDGPCLLTSDYVRCNLFFCNCFGCLCPCSIKIPLGQGEESEDKDS